MAPLLSGAKQELGELLSARAPPHLPGKCGAAPGPLEHVPAHSDGTHLAQVRRGAHLCVYAWGGCQGQEPQGQQDTDPKVWGRSPAGWSQGSSLWEQRQGRRELPPAPRNVAAAESN